MSQTRLRWGIVGIDATNALAVAQAIEASASGALVAIAGSMDGATKFANSFDDTKSKGGKVAVYDKYEKLLAARNVDAVYIMQPTYEQIMSTIHARKHILCEPLCNFSSDQLSRIINKLKATAGIFCQEAMLYRAHPFYADLKRIIVTEKKLGDVRFINSVYTTGPTALEYNRGGSIVNVGYYPLSFIRHLVNAEPTSIEVSGSMHPDSNEDCEATLILHFPDSVKATLLTANNVVLSWQFQVIGTRGTLSVMSDPLFPGKHGKIHLALFDPLLPNMALPQEEIELFYSDTPIQSYAIDELGKCIRSKASTNDAVTLSHTLGNIKVVEESRKKLAEKQPAPAHSPRSSALVSVSHFSPKRNEEKDKSTKPQLYIPPKLTSKKS